MQDAIERFNNLRVQEIFGWNINDFNIETNVSSERTQPLKPLTTGDPRYWLRYLKSGPNEPPLIFASNPGDARGNTMLHYLAVTGSADDFKEALKQGANPFAQNDDGSTPVMVAVRAGNVDVLKDYVECCKPLKSQIITLLDYARENNSQDVIPYLESLELLEDEVVNLNRALAVLSSQHFLDKLLDMAKRSQDQIKILHTFISYLDGHYDILSKKQCDMLLQCHEQFSDKSLFNEEQLKALKTASEKNDAAEAMVYEVETVLGADDDQTDLLTLMDLPLDILSLIMYFLPSSDDFKHMSFVNKTFHAISTSCWEFVLSSYAPGCELKPHQSAKETFFFIRQNLQSYYQHIIYEFNIPSPPAPTPPQGQQFGRALRFLADPGNFQPDNNPQRGANNYIGNPDMLAAMLGDDAVRDLAQAPLQLPWVPPANINPGQGGGGLFANQPAAQLQEALMQDFGQAEHDGENQNGDGFEGPN